VVDVVDAATRSRMMAGIRSRDTRPEVQVRHALHARGFRYRLQSGQLPGKPDIVLPKWRTVVFVHGCFWHWHGCALSKLPASNTDFWRKKLSANKQRDSVVRERLLAEGWRIAVVWECATRGAIASAALPRALDRLAAWIRLKNRPTTFELGAPLVRRRTRGVHA